MLWVACFAYIWDYLAIMGLPVLVLSLHQANYKLTWGTYQGWEAGAGPFWAPVEFGSACCFTETDS